MKRRSKDDRPKWDDPNMPVIRNYKMPDGKTAIEVDPIYERRYRGHMIDHADHPNYKDDPTYNIRRKK